MRLGIIYALYIVLLFGASEAGVVQSNEMFCCSGRVKNGKYINNKSQPFKGWDLLCQSMDVGLYFFTLCFALRPLTTSFVMSSASFA